MQEMWNSQPTKEWEKYKLTSSKEFKKITLKVVT